MYAVNIEFDGKDIGIIHIPIQGRPFYLKRHFGKLKKEVVYIRRGSSTDIAKPDEIVKMGSSFLSIDEKKPILELHYADIENRDIIRDDLTISSLVLYPPPKKDIPDYESRSSSPWGLGLDFNRTNYNYYKELTHFICCFSLFSSINFAIENSGPTVANDVRLEIKIPDPDNIIRMLDEYDFPSVPKRSYSSFHLTNYSLEPIGINRGLTVKRVSFYWCVEAQVEKVQPKSIAWIESCLYLGSIETSEISLEATLYADNLSEPVKKHFTIEAEATQRKVTLDDIKYIEKERFKNSPEYEKLMKMHGNKED